MMRDVHRLNVNLAALLLAGCTALAQDPLPKPVVRPVSEASTTIAGNCSGNAGTVEIDIVPSGAGMNTVTVRADCRGDAFTTQTLAGVNLQRGWTVRAVHVVDNRRSAPAELQVSAAPPMTPPVIHTVETTADRITGSCVPTTPEGTVQLEFRTDTGVHSLTTPVRCAGGSFIVPAADLPAGVRDGDRLRVGTPITAVLIVDGRRSAPSEQIFIVPAPSDGHLVGLSFGGVVLSQQAERFTQADPFFGFLAGYNGRERAGIKPLFGGRFKLRFQGVFQAAPRAAQAPLETANGTANNQPNPCLSTDANTASQRCLPFLSSRKTFDTDVHAWWEFKPIARILGLGFYGAIGASTVTDRTELQTDDPVLAPEEEARAAGVGGNGNGDATATGNRPRLDTERAITDNDLKKFYEGGLVLNLYNLSHNRLFLNSFLGYGNYEALAHLVPGANTKHRFVGKLRIFPKMLDVRVGRGVDLVPMFGVDLNAGYGPDQLRVFTGFAIDLRPPR